MGRLSSKRRAIRLTSDVVEQWNNDGPDELHCWTLPSMQEAVTQMLRSQQYLPNRGDRLASFRFAQSEATHGNPQRLANAIAESEDLVAAAIAADPRLARRSQWVRGEEGEVVCPALLSQGDDAPCFYRTRALVGQPNGAEPVRIVISTDANAIPPGTAAAFIATVRLVQQYRPIEVYWQGSWLSKSRCTGWVFHVPLVNGDMDYSRLEFCIDSPTRDLVSWSVMMVHSCEGTHASWTGCNLQATRSYLPGAQFVSHHGIAPTGRSIAFTAAEWLGWESLYDVRWEREQTATAALQSMPEPTVAPKAITDEDRARWKAEGERYELERQTRESEAAAQRVAALSHNYS